MQGVLGQGHGQGQRCLGRQAITRDRPAQPHARFGERAGFVKNHRVHTCQSFNGLQASHQYTLARQQTCAGQHGRGRGQRQGTRAGHNQHSNRRHDGAGGVCGPPVSHCQQGSKQHKPQKWLGNAVRQHRQSRLVHGRALHQGHDTGITRVLTNLQHPHQYCGRQVVAAGHDSVARGFGQRAGLAAQKCLVHQASSALQYAIRSKSLSGQHPQHIIRHQSPHGHQLKLTAGQTALYAVGQALHQRV